MAQVNDQVNDVVVIMKDNVDKETFLLTLPMRFFSRCGAEEILFRRYFYN